MKNINNIMIIDDNKIDCFVNQKVIKLAYDHIKVKVFNSGVTALDYFSDNTKESEAIHFLDTDLILLDINMPVINGFDFLDELVKTNAFIKNPFDVYFLSSSNNECDINKALDNKFCSGYIIKPLTKDKLKMAVETKSQKRNKCVLQS